MTDQLALFLAVLDPLATVYAVAAGLAFGSTVLLWLSLEFPSKIMIPAKLAGFLSVILFAGAGGLFFAGQIFEAYESGDPFWPRALGRAALWGIFSLSMGVGVAVSRSFAHDAIKKGTQ